MEEESGVRPGRLHQANEDRPTFGPRVLASHRAGSLASRNVRTLLASSWSVGTKGTKDLVVAAGLAFRHGSAVCLSTLGRVESLLPVSAKELSGGHRRVAEGNSPLRRRYPPVPRAPSKTSSFKLDALASAVARAQPCDASGTPAPGPAPVPAPGPAAGREESWSKERSRLTTSLRVPAPKDRAGPRGRCARAAAL